jgi:asparagine synthase (glutamine-hydrolysing)
MCGLAGKLSFEGLNNKQAHAQIQLMLQKLIHRGPDGSEIYSNSKEICLGAVRLSMIDSTNQSTLLFNENNSIVLAYNGEIYNHTSLRDKLVASNHKFKTHNDGEVIIHLYEEIGMNFINALDGMFAFALWDNNRQRLILARDHIGIKPLYYYRDNAEVIFSSEMKAILSTLPITPSLNINALSSYYNYRFIPAPLTPFEKIHKLEPGSMIVFEHYSQQHINFWSPDKATTLESRNFKEILTEAIISTSVSDHNLGVFLSGGLDSSVILSTLSEASTTNITSFTVGYDIKGYENESEYALSVARHCGSKNHYIEIKSQELLKEINKSWTYLDEPLYSTVSVSTYVLATLASSMSYKGILTGDGSDELLMGYNYLFNTVDAVKNNEDWVRQYSKSIGWFSNIWRKKLLCNINHHKKLTLLNTLPGNHPLEQVRYFELRYRLPEYHLARVDRLTMAHSLEARVPFLRKDVVSWALNESAFALATPGKQKDVLRLNFAHLLPSNINKRKKQPFTTPFISWMQGPLKQNIYDLLLTHNFSSSLGFSKNDLEAFLLDCYRHNDEENFRTLWGIFSLYKWYEATMTHTDNALSC